MSYGHAIYFGGYDTAIRDYEAFVASSLRTLGEWEQATHLPLDLGRDRRLHEYRLCDAGSDEIDLTSETSVSVWVGLRHNNPDTCDYPIGSFPYWICVETGAGRTPLSLAVQFMVVASAFNHLRDAVVIDDQSGDPESLVVYRQRDEFLKHTARVFPRMYDGDHIRNHALLDSFWKELRRELSHCGE